MPFLIANAPVRSGKECSFRSKDAVRDDSSMGSLCPMLNLLGFVGWMDLMVRTHWREMEGHKKRGGSVNIRFEGRGGMLMVWCQFV